MSNLPAYKPSTQSQKVWTWKTCRYPYLTDHRFGKEDRELLFKFKFKDCLTRQISEAIRINSSKDALLNSKGEYGGNFVSRLSVKEDVWDRRERDRREDEQVEEDKRLVAEFRMRKLIQTNNTDAGPTTAVPATLSGGYSTDEDEFKDDDDDEDTGNDRSARTTMMTSLMTNLDQTTTISNRSSMVPPSNLRTE